MKQHLPALRLHLEFLKNLPEPLNKDSLKILKLGDTSTSSLRNSPSSRISSRLEKTIEDQVTETIVGVEA